MQTELSDEAWDEVGEARLTAPDGRTYRRRGTRATRRHVGEILTEGAPLVLHYWGGAQLTWYDGDDARMEWDRVKRHVVQQPSTRGQVEWTAGVWEDDEGHKLAFLDGHC